MSGCSGRYRSWMDGTGALLTVQPELMRLASVTTAMNVYGKAMTDSKRPRTRLSPRQTIACEKWLAASKGTATDQTDLREQLLDRDRN